MTEYAITLLTANRKNGGTAGKVSVEIRCESGVLPITRVAGPLSPGLLPGARASTSIENASLGRPRVVRVYLEGDPWFLDEVHVTFAGETFVFPHHDWVHASRVAILLPIEARLPQHEEPTIAAARSEELAYRFADFAIAAGDGLPPHLREQQTDRLPPSARFTEERRAEFAAHKKRAEINALTVTAKQLFDRWDRLDDESELYPMLPVPASRTPWAKARAITDEELGRQCVAGVAPTHIRRVASLDGVPESLRTLDGTKWVGGSWQSAIDAKRLYALDYAILRGIPLYDDGHPNGERRYCPAAFALLHDSPTRGLVPVAIELDARSVASSHALALTPDDPRWDLAKAYLKVAEANIHQIVTHALFTHLAMEPFILAAQRRLSTRHPLYKVVRRHLYGTLEINAEARQLLLARGGVFDEFIATGGPSMGHIALATNAWESWSVDALLPPNDVASRGVETLAYYPYRDQALRLWDAIVTYVRASVHASYPSESDLTDDPEAQAMLADLRTMQWIRGDRKVDRAYLVDLVAFFVFTVSVQHAAVNFQQYDHFGFVPNAPAAARGAFPTSAPDETAWLRLLPDRKQSLRQSTVAWSLSLLADDDERLLPATGAWRARYVEPSSPLDVAVRAFWQAMRFAEESAPHDYPWLRPSRVPVSTSV